MAALAAGWRLPGCLAASLATNRCIAARVSLAHGLAASPPASSHNARARPRRASQKGGALFLFASARCGITRATLAASFSPQENEMRAPEANAPCLRGRAARFLF